jgi:hypothetical protein
MNCCDCKRIVVLSTEGEYYTKCLKILFFIYIFVIIGKIIAQDYDSIISNIICIFLLIITFIQANFLFAGILIFFVCSNLFYTLIFLGLRIQNRSESIIDKFSGDNGLYWYAVIFSILSVIFFLCLIYYSFKAYKEYKYCYKNYGHNSRGVDEEIRPLNRGDDRQDYSSAQPSDGFRAFTGRGQAVG